MTKNEMAQVIEHAIANSAINENHYRVVTIDFGDEVCVDRVRIVAHYTSKHLLSPYKPKLSVSAYLRGKQGFLELIGKTTVSIGHCMAHEIAEWICDLDDN